MINPKLEDEINNLLLVDIFVVKYKQGIMETVEKMPADNCFLLFTLKNTEYYIDEVNNLYIVIYANINDKNPKIKKLELSYQQLNVIIRALQYKFKKS